MNTWGRKRRTPYGEAPEETHVTLEDERVKELVKRQLNTETNLQDELSLTKKSFTSGVLMKDDTAQKTGVRSLVQFQALETHEQRVAQLRDSGLTEREIEIKLSNKPEHKHFLKLIDNKIAAHVEQLSRDIRYANTVEVSRREYDTNRVGGRKHLAHLVTVKKDCSDSLSDLVSATLKDFEKRNTKEDIFTEEFDSSSSDEDNETPQRMMGPQLCDVNERVSPVPLDEIRKNRVDVKQIEKFKNYKMGDPSKTLYVKNLPRNINTTGLASVFVNFYEKLTSPVTYKLLSGRMKGRGYGRACSSRVQWLLVEKPTNRHLVRKKHIN